MSPHNPETAQIPRTEPDITPTPHTVSAQGSLAFPGGNETVVFTPTPEQLQVAAEEERVKRFGEFVTNFAMLDPEDLRPNRRKITEDLYKDRPPKFRDKPLTTAHTPDGTVDWRKVVLEDRAISHSGNIYPANALERLRIRRNFNTKQHLRTMTAAETAARGGVYEIGMDGKSAWRGEDGSLDHLPRRTQKAIKNDEKNYRRLSEEKHHAEYKLNHIGEKGINRTLRKEHRKKTIQRIKQAPANLDRAFARKTWKHIDKLKARRAAKKASRPIA